jgi:type IV fimbrial biogenesis protein FimT
MKTAKIQSGFTLNELLVVMAIIALMVGIGVPASKQLMKSFESGDGVEAVIAAALNNAKSMAVREGKHAGVRFQRDNFGDQYMIFIVHDFNATGLAYGFLAVPGRKPVRLPRSIGVMDMRIRTNDDPQYSGDEPIDGDDDIDDQGSGPILGSFEFNDTTSFSIVFSPMGKLVIHEVRVRNRHGATDDSSSDDVFNTSGNVNSNPELHGLFIQDDTPEISPGNFFKSGYGQEYSRNNFIIYDRKAFESVPVGERFSRYLGYLTPFYINAFTGEIIK